MKRFKAIAAMSLNRVIGRGSEIPWHLPDDFKFFKHTTMGHVLVMGRKTFQSIGRALPGRETVVLSRTGFSHPDVRVINSLEELQSLGADREIFICGGAEIYRQALPDCRELLLTHVKREVEGDAFFPAFEDQFVEVEALKDTDDFKIIRYQNKSLA